MARRLVARETVLTGVVSETTQTAVEDEVLANVEETESSKATAPAIEDDNAEEALRNAGAKSNLKNGIQSDNAEEAFAEKSDDKSNSQHPEAYTAEQADIPKYNYDAEKATEFIKSKSKENSAKQQLKTLICLFCDKKFENEELIKDHTNIEHKSGRLRFKRI